MKQFFSFLAVVLLAMGAMAQPKMPTFRFGEMNKGYDYMMSHNSHIIAEQGGELIIATIGLSQHSIYWFFYNSMKVTFC